MTFQRLMGPILVLVFHSAMVLAQDLDLKPDDNSEVETLYDRLDEEAESTAVAKPAPPPPRATPAEEKKIETLTDLATLQNFEDIATIQRRFLPKTKRFELSGLGFSNLNNPFFNNLGGGIKFAYHFTEAWGLEAIGNWYGVAARQVTKDLEKAGVSTANVVTARSFMGAALRWNPIYGKISLLNRSIVPFDLGFSVGGGLTKTDEASGEGTLHLGTHQIFAISKSFAVRWDIMWNLYQAAATDENGVKETVSHNDLFLGVGLSWYFPEAGYR